MNREHQQIWMIPGGVLHVAWSHGNPGEATSPTGYMYSLDYGATWSGSEIAIDTRSTGNLPHGIVADTNWVHIIAEPGAGIYARRLAPRSLEFTSIENEETGVILNWIGQGLLQQAQDVNGPWNTITNALSPYRSNRDFATRFFKLKGP